MYGDAIVENADVAAAEFAPNALIYAKKYFYPSGFCKNFIILSCLGSWDM
jgi:hypothetical protein